MAVSGAASRHSTSPYQTGGGLVPESPLTRRLQALTIRTPRHMRFGPRGSMIRRTKTEVSKIACNLDMIQTMAVDSKPSEGGRAQRESTMLCPEKKTTTVSPPLRRRRAHSLGSATFDSKQSLLDPFHIDQVSKVQMLAQLSTLRVDIPPPFKIYEDQEGSGCSDSWTHYSGYSGLDSDRSSARDSVTSCRSDVLGRRRKRLERAQAHYTPSPLNMVMPPLTPSNHVRKSRRRGSLQKPLHLWKTKHVAKWASKMAPNSVKNILSTKLDGKRLLRVESEAELAKLGWSQKDDLANVLREFQQLQTEDVLWHVESLKTDAKSVLKR
eukprot:CAMPEP_0167787854 /NCGR_PEP_ID=MMETSP0111_2-20121227/9679_1 /TAXON_ID=91324 /ORGANISM="Lotharella globosa, Strain CCCM811" /LENGTH=324 /DNA_ID=CAMNT_0007679593 /DNA_START=61 /DNA_END=1035 /DNA_ORIENTATION=+